MSEASTNGLSRILSSLGLCARARKLIFGVPMICDALRKGGAAAPLAVFEASDTSDNTHKRLSDKCAYYGARLIRLECDGETLAAALGKSAVLAAVAVTDKNMLAMVEKNIAQGQTKQKTQTV